MSSDKRRTQLSVLLAVISTAAAVVFMTELIMDMPPEFHSSLKNVATRMSGELGGYILVLLVFPLGVVGGAFLARRALRYLGSSSEAGERRDDSASPDSLAALRNEVRQLRRQFTAKSHGAGAEKLEETLSSIRGDILADARSRIVPDVEGLFASRLEAARPRMQLQRVADDLRGRLQSQIETLYRRSNWNLLIGSGVTVLALLVLSVMAFGNPGQISPTGSVEGLMMAVGQMALHYVPRLTLVIFIEVFAFFFLKEYRAALVEIKYFHNEYTNVESRLIGLLMAVETGDETKLDAPISALLTTERNFILEKGQSTVGTEARRLESEEMIAVIEKVTDAVKAAKK